MTITPEETEYIIINIYDDEPTGDTQTEDTGK